MDHQHWPREHDYRGDLAEQVARCRRLADALTDRQTIATLTELAREYEARIRRPGHA